MTKCEEVFKTEISSIQNVDIRNYVIAIFEELAPDYFWTAPASTSAKYHPKIGLGNGGLVRHTKLAVFWGIELYEAMVAHSFGLDEVTAALLLHDLTKQSGGPGGHGVELAKALKGKQWPPQGDPAFASVELIIFGVESHMGVWTKPEGKSPNWRNSGLLRNFCSLVHLADYCASRKVDAFVEGLE